MKIFNLFIILLLISNSCISKNDKYVDIPRTKISIIVPEGYEIIKSQAGLRKNNIEAILIKEFNEKSFYSISKNMKDGYEKQGLNVFEYEETTISGFQAKIFKTSTTEDNYNCWSLLFGDSTFCTIIVSTYQANDIKSEKELKKILLSLKYYKNKKINPFEGTYFEVDTTSTIFKFVQFTPDMYIFEPSTDIDSINKASSICLMPMITDSSLTLEYFSKMSIDILEGIGYLDFKMDTTSIYKKEDYNAMLKIGECYYKAKRIYYYQLVFIKKDYCLLTQAFCDYDNISLKSDIEKFCNKINLINL